MQTLNVQVEKTSLDVINCSYIVSNSVEYIYCEFDFDDTWDGMSKIAKFKNRKTGVSKHVILDSTNRVAIPWEVLVSDGKLSISVQGTKDTTKVTTKMQYYIDIILADNIDNSTEPNPPTKDVLDQVVETVSQLDKTKADETALQTQKARIDNLSTNTGTTVNDLELQDVRVGADGTTYKNAGEAVREQYSKNSNKITANTTLINDYKKNVDNVMLAKSVSGTSIAITDSADWHTLDLSVTGATTVTPTNPSLPISVDNIAILDSPQNFDLVSTGNLKEDRINIAHEMGQWNEIKDGNYIKGAEVVVYDGSADENWKSATTTTANLRWAITPIVPAMPNTSNTRVADIYCNKFKPTIPNDSYYSVEGITINTSSEAVIYLYKDALKNMTLEQFRAWLALNPITVRYKRKNTASAPYNVELKTYKGTTNIVTTANVKPTLTVKYAQDINTVIANLTSAITSLGGKV